MPRDLLWICIAAVAPFIGLLICCEVYTTVEYVPDDRAVCVVKKYLGDQLVDRVVLPDCAPVEEFFQ